jgi:UDPglucose--hexose-1-phosphate uridylyltransferase
MPSEVLFEKPHRRRNALTGDWVLVSPHRTLRPWQGQVEKSPPEQRPAYDPDCYLCPGNSRAGGKQNPRYEGTYVFGNDFAALLPEPGAASEASSHLLRAEAESGSCRVLCFSPRHDLTLPEMEVAAIRAVVDLWGAQCAELGNLYRWVQVFENKGAVMGCSNPHPHGQIWAGTSLPNEPAKEDRCQRDWFQAGSSPLLIDYAHLELTDGRRVVVSTPEWVAVVPFWALWPFETLLIPTRPVQRLTDLTDAERDSLAGILKRLLTRYDNLFAAPFPYSMGWHGAPTGPAHAPGDSPHWQLHAHFFPPLLRSATVKKFMVGYEMLGEPQRDLTPEQAAARLQALSEVHYRHAGVETSGAGSDSARPGGVQS